MSTSGWWLSVSVLVATTLSGCQQPDTALDQDVDLAFRVCAEALKLTAKNPSTAKVPRVNPTARSQTKHRYDWNHGDGLAFTNGFGAAVDQTASCMTEGGHISLLSINGKVLPEEQLALLRVNALVRVSKSTR